MRLSPVAGTTNGSSGDAPEPARWRAMGLSFSTPLGVAAGVDRDGSFFALRDLTGFGHVEIGTLTSGQTAKCAGAPYGLRLGVNIGSKIEGLDESVIADFAAILRQAYSVADYLCFNLTAPHAGRDSETCGVGRLIQQLIETRDNCAAEAGRRKPLLVKIHGGLDGAPLPTALLEAKRRRLDGIVLVSSSLARIAAVRLHIGPMALISVGGVRTAEEAMARIEAGASLVQAHAAVIDGGLEELSHPWRRKKNRPHATPSIGGDE